MGHEFLLQMSYQWTQFAILIIFIQIVIRMKMKIFHDVIKSFSSHGITYGIISKILPRCPVMSFAR